MALSVTGAATCLAAGQGLAATSTAPPQADRTGQPSETPATTRKGDMLYRTLGRTGETISLVGIGGSHLGKPEEDEAIAIVRRAVDAGVTFMDNSWDYNQGDSELRMGKALKDGYRDKVFLMTKVDGRDKKTAARQIEESLMRLRTGRVDLMQFHEVIRMEDADRFFAKDGALHAFLEARQAGKIRFIGFTGHKDPVVHLRMLELAREHEFTFDTVQMPLNVMDAHFRSFQNQVLPAALGQGIGVLGMKPLGGSFIVKSNAVSAKECLHYAMSLPTSCVITGIDSLPLLDQALEAVRTFEPLTADQTRDLLARTRELARSGQYEPFKTTSHFDSTAQNPEWLGPPE
ncbi:NADP-dependent oxidoreductase domain protein [Solidesulfovibrio carbinoliphilus subsp. oakridgensis]|uniref:NADP-dependent oxidoreductase domain protein n=1 Tax=Solidesulfovibrio carbinoliphilus subsp. oakridgensis TaxID=694327 RepID=G7Q8D8_9BACT|nr:aldo/keto reductase [Solidesulfovibrio carbinoliphilus]EHJ48550.1 NADP-dependent oxidoreductase domain protein [Solidesulfovibrio carbinoliphilus subsp. oakridgensis]